MADNSRIRAEIDAAQLKALKAQDAKMTLVAQEEALEVINQGVRVMQRIVEYLETANLEGGYCTVCKRRGVSVAEASKAAANLVKCVNDLGRYVHFDRGEADSRAEVKGLDELLKYLTREQFDTVWKWVEDGEQKLALQ